MVEHQIVDLAVAGSSPVFHPNRVVSALVAQLDRAPDFESVGRRFESFRAQRFGFLKFYCHGPLAQLVEQQTLNLRVKGSIPLRLNTWRTSLRGKTCTARVVKLADTPDLGSGTLRCRGSSPLSRKGQSKLDCLAKRFFAKVAQW